MLAATDSLVAALRDALPAARVITDPLRRLAYGTDASFYRLVPQVVLVVDSEPEVLVALAVRFGSTRLIDNMRIQIP